MVSRYISAKKFDDFKNNQEELINVLNHNMTKLTESVSRIEKLFLELMGKFKVINKLIWWILGIIGLFVGTVCIGMVFS